MWLDDRLPGLEATHRLGLTYDLIWLSAVWMHVAPSERTRAFRKLVTLLRPGGRMVLSLRHGPTDWRSLHEVRADEVERLASDHGMQVLLVREQLDALGRSEVGWTLMVLALPDDSTGALPLVRGIILNDRKTSTYKLALLRIIARIADGSAGIAEPNDEYIRIPLGLVALYWIRAFKPLLAQEIPQSGTDRRGAGLGFVKEPFRALDVVSPLDLRLGTRLVGAEAEALRLALADAARTIKRMPASFLTFADGTPILPTEFGVTPPSAPEFEISREILWQYGVIRVPRHLWQALRRLSVWIEPMLIAEWTRLSQRYAELKGRSLAIDTIAAALRWFDPQRETEGARRRALALLEGGRPIYCVWSKQRLDERTLDIDHCLPWSAWPCDDLWNLMPAHRRVNQREKRERIVSGDLLRQAEERITEWWQRAYLTDAPEFMHSRFWQEARGTLPLVATDLSGEDLGDILLGIELQRRRIKHDQQLEEWYGVAR